MLLDPKLILRKVDSKTSLIFFVFFLPLLISPVSSELFELPKTAFLYLFSGVFLLLIILRPKTNPFNKKALLLLLIFLTPNILSFFFSSFKPTSFFGYYTRFNGGLLSIFAYSVIFLYVSTLKKSDILSILKAISFGSLIVSLYAVLQHFGIDKSLWIQDSQKRVFSTLGQPNWLASYLLLVMPISYMFYLTKDTKNKFMFLFIFLINYLALYFTYSLSGLTGFFVLILLLFLLTLIGFKERIANFFIVIFFVFIFSVFFLGPYKQRIQNFILNFQQSYVALASFEFDYERPLVDDTSIIRKYVWLGTTSLIFSSPKNLLIGQGQETFAYNFLAFRPKELNNTSEWDFIFNKPHNLFLETLQEIGFLGFVLYAFIFVYFFTLVLKIKNGIFLYIGVVACLVSFFFGWSTVTTDSLIAIFLALIIVESSSNQNLNYFTKSYKKIAFLKPLGILLVTLLIFFSIWFFTADFMYIRGKKYNFTGKKGKAVRCLDIAIKMFPFEPRYKIELARVVSPHLSEVTIGKAYANNSNNLVIVKTGGYLLQKLGTQNPLYYQKSVEYFAKATSLCPTDPENYFEMAKSLLMLKKIDEARESLKTALELKPNYNSAQKLMGEL